MITLIKGILVTEMDIFTLWLQERLQFPHTLGLSKDKHVCETWNELIENL